MKSTSILKSALSLVLMIFFFQIESCSDNDELHNLENSVDLLSEYDKEALLFMLEEEKLARDTYIYLNTVWGLNQFENISNSEQTHMDIVENVLVQFDVAYTILPRGEFQNSDLQAFYEQFITNGSLNETSALKVGAKIEDLDIVDLANYLENITNTDIASVFNRLQCGSRNHLRSFVSALEMRNDTYIPEFLDQETYATIINSTHENCN